MNVYSFVRSYPGTRVISEDFNKKKFETTDTVGLKNYCDLGRVPMFVIPKTISPWKSPV